MNWYRGSYIHDDIVDGPVDYVSDHLNVLLGNPLQSHTEECLPCVAIVSRMEMLSYITVLMASITHLLCASSFQDQIHCRTELRTFNSQVLQDKAMKAVSSHICFSDVIGHMTPHLFNISKHHNLNFRVKAK